MERLETYNTENFAFNAPLLGNTIPVKTYGKNTRIRGYARNAEVYLAKTNSTKGGTAVPYPTVETAP
jgi:hypothetical protein